MQSRTITLVWAAGLSLAALIYVVGPDHALDSLFGLADEAAQSIQQLVVLLGGRAFDILRALAIGCFAIFFILSVVAGGRGLPGRWQLLGVTVLFLLLVWHQGPEATGHWLLAFVLAAAAALNVTRRLGGPPGVA